jgi:hypothetical protein
MLCIYLNSYVIMQEVENRKASTIVIESERVEQVGEA